MGVEYNMCKYCENAANELEVYSDLRLRASIETRRGNPYIEIWGSLDGGYLAMLILMAKLKLTIVLCAAASFRKKRIQNLEK